jgi:hypothetical protein
MLGKLLGDKFTFVPCCDVPALPGAIKRWEHNGLADKDLAKACSRPPDPRRRIFMVLEFSAKLAEIAPAAIKKP